MKNLEKLYLDKVGLEAEMTENSDEKGSVFRAKAETSLESFIAAVAMTKPESSGMVYNTWLDEIILSKVLGVFPIFELAEDISVLMPDPWPCKLACVDRFSESSALFYRRVCFYSDDSLPYVLSFSEGSASLNKEFGLWSLPTISRS
jgi:hypothetical protein